MSAETTETKDLPQVYQLSLTKAELQLLTFGLNAQALNFAGNFMAQLQEEFNVVVAFKAWCEFQEQRDRDPSAMIRDVSARIAVLLGLKLCPDCQQYHAESFE